MNIYWIYLMIAGVIGFLVLYTGILKQWKRLKFVISAIVVVVIVSVPTIVMWQTTETNAESERDAEVKALVVEFLEKYNADDFNKIIKAGKATAYIVERAKTDGNGLIDEEAGTKQSLFIGGKWFELTVLEENNGG